MKELSGMYSKNNLFIPFEEYKSVGGPTTFMSNLRRYLDEVGYKYTISFSEKNSIFFPVDYDLETLKKVKKNRGNIIQRLDGVFYHDLHTQEQLDFGEKMKDIYINYANHIIFQSEYSKSQCFTQFGKKKTDEYSLIINGVNKDIFFPSSLKQKNPNDKFVFITTGNFRNEYMLEPIIEALDEIRMDTTAEFILKVVGPIKENLKKYLNRNYIEYLGVKDINGIAELLRASDAFIFSQINPPCPNSVIEAISSGMPVIGFDSGAMSELLFFNRDLLADVSDDLFQKPSDLNSVKLKEKILLCLFNYPKYKTIAGEYSYLYDFRECGSLYIKAFDKVLNSKKKRNSVKYFLDNLFKK